MGGREWEGVREGEGMKEEGRWMDGEKGREGGGEGEREGGREEER